MAEMPGFSPPMRGWSYLFTLLGARCCLFPAHAGVILRNDLQIRHLKPFPSPAGILHRIIGAMRERSSLT